jgi:hypothetical protein
MIVASFFAPRPEHPRWRDYLPSLRLLQASCDRLGLTHVIIGDAPVAGLDVLQCSGLPGDLMRAIIEGQRRAIECLDDDLLLVGADCVIVRDPRGAMDGADMAVTIGDFADCALNTGAIWISRGARDVAADMWGRALARMGAGWGDDQLAIAAEVAPLQLPPAVAERHGLRVRFLDVDPWNLAPDHVVHDVSHAAVLHFRGRRKDWSAEWCARFLGLAPCGA